MANYQKNYEKQKLLESNFEKVMINDELWGQLKNRIITQEQKSNPKFKSNIAANQFGTVLENERRWILNEAVNTNFDVAKVSKVVMPLVRRYWPLLIQNEIVSTQQITAPTGFIRRLVVRYQETELPGIIPMSGQNIPQATELVTTVDNTNTEQTFVKTGLTQNISLGTIQVKLTRAGQEPISIQVDDGLGKLVGSYNGEPVVGSVDYTNGVVVVYFVNQAPAPADAWELKIDYAKDWTSQVDSDFNGREVTFDITNEPITVSERKLRAKWSPEFWEDVSAIDGLDAQVEMYDNVANIIAQEINSQILNELYNGFSKENYVEWDKQQPVERFYGTRKDWYETFMIKVNELQATMASRTNIAEPNVLVMHPTSLAILRNALQSYGATEIKPLSHDNVNVGYKKYDINGGTYKAYTTNLVPTDEILMVYRGQKIEESGYVYAPYVPLTQVPWTEPTGQMGIVFHTRYATKLFRPDWFGKIKVLNPTVG